MNHSLSFYIFNILAVIGWFFLIFLPNLKFTKIIIRSGFLSIFFCFSYMVICFIAITSKAPGGFQNLNELMLLFKSKDWVLTGWIHYLAFDLFIGVWIFHDSLKNNIKHATIIPSLLFTLFLGPFGLLSYYIFKAIKLKKLWDLDEKE